LTVRGLEPLPVGKDLKMARILMYWIIPRYWKAFPSQTEIGLRHALRMTDLFDNFFYSVPIIIYNYMYKPAQVSKLQLSDNSGYNMIIEAWNLHDLNAVRFVQQYIFTM